MMSKTKTKRIRCVIGLREAKPKKAKTVKQPTDPWETPDECTRALLAAEPPPLSATVLDPSAGNGAILRVLRGEGYRCRAIELRHECRAELVSVVGEAGVTIGDWLYLARQLRVPHVDREAIVGNPPFSPSRTMLAHVTACLSGDHPYVALLLPLEFSCGLSRAALWDRDPPSLVCPLRWRPRFCAAGGGMRSVAWFVWLRGLRGGPGLRLGTAFRPLDRPFSPLSTCSVVRGGFRGGTPLLRAPP